VPNIGIGGNMNPIGSQKIGQSTAFAEIHGTKMFASSRMKIPVGTDMYD